MRVLLLLILFWTACPVTYSQGDGGDLDIEFSFQSGHLGASPYSQGDVYLNCYAWDNVPISWGIGLGFRDGMRYQHFHTTLGPVLGVLGFAAGISPTENAVYPGYDQWGNPEYNGEYDEYGNHIGVSYEEERGSFFGGIVLGVLGLIMPEKIGIDLKLNDKLIFQPYARALGMHVAKKGRGEQARIRYNGGLGIKALVRFPNSDTKFGLSSEYQVVNNLGHGLFYGGHLSFPLNY